MNGPRSGEGFQAGGYDPNTTPGFVVSPFKRERMSVKLIRLLDPSGRTLARPFSPSP